MTAKNEVKISGFGQFLLGIVGTFQIALALAAFSDLWARDHDEVRGPKPAWIPVILINWIGPLVYFIGGVKR